MPVTKGEPLPALGHVLHVESKCTAGTKAKSVMIQEIFLFRWNLLQVFLYSACALLQLTAPMHAVLQKCVSGIIRGIEGALCRTAFRLAHRLEAKHRLPEDKHLGDTEGFYVEFTLVMHVRCTRTQQACSAAAQPVSGHIYITVRRRRFEAAGGSFEFTRTGCRGASAIGYRVQKLVCVLMPHDTEKSAA